MRRLVTVGLVGLVALFAPAVPAVPAPSAAAIDAGAAALRFPTPAAAYAGGYRFASSSRGVSHYVKARPSGAEPDGLMFGPDGRVVAALVLRHRPGTEPGWHRHTYCSGPGGFGVAAGTCPAGTSATVSPAMRHVWVGDSAEKRWNCAIRPRRYRI